MNARAESLVRYLGMRPHPEGGYYVEKYRSPELVTTSRGVTRSALTTIFFLLADGGFSRWHRVLADEAWHYYEGAALALRWTTGDGKRVVEAELGRLAEHERGAQSTPVLVVPAGCWQTAQTAGEYTLVGCTVGPGFDFADFELLRDHHDAAARIVARHPEARRWL